MPLFNKVFDTTNMPDTIDISIWGPPRSGKTNLIVMLQFSDLEGWAIRSAHNDREANKFLKNGMVLMRLRKEFVPATRAEEGRFYNFEFESPKGLFRKRTFRVVLPEFPGEFYQNPTPDSELTQKIGKGHGILWLIDPIRIFNSTLKDEKSYPEMIYEWLGILHEYQGGGRLKHNMAFCLTKMDDPVHSKHFDTPREYCLDILGEEVRYFLEYFADPKKVEFFSTSSAGFISESNESNVDPNDNSKLLHKPKPVGLFEPFKWLFDVL